MRKCYEGRRVSADPMTNYVSHLLDSGLIETDQEIVGGGSYLALIGRRVVHGTGYGTVELYKFPTVERAEQEFEFLSFPDDTDLVIYEDHRIGYSAVCEDEDIATSDDLNTVKENVRQWMDTAGYFPDVWLVNDRGNYSRVTDL